MPNFEDFIKQITLDASSDVKSYVYYNEETGEVIKVSSRPAAAMCYNVIEVAYSQVKDLILGKQSFNDYIVEYDSALKQLALKKIKYEDNVTSIVDRLYNIPSTNTNTNTNTDITFFINSTSNKVTIVANEKLRSDKHLYRLSDNIRMNFSITAKNDPNVLYENFNILLKDLLENEQMDVTKLFRYTPELSQFSIYTTKYFDTYSLEVT